MIQTYNWRTQTSQGFNSRSGLGPHLLGQSRQHLIGHHRMPARTTGKRPGRCQPIEQWLNVNRVDRFQQPSQLGGITRPGRMRSATQPAGRNRDQTIMIDDRSNTARYPEWQLRELVDQLLDTAQRSSRDRVPGNPDRHRPRQHHDTAGSRLDQLPPVPVDAMTVQRSSHDALDRLIIRPRVPSLPSHKRNLSPAARMAFKLSDEGR